ncbi:MAG: serine hydrolase domain-containing protein [Gemmatimonadaceae bacterium]
MSLSRIRCRSLMLALGATVATCAVSLGSARAQAAPSVSAMELDSIIRKAVADKQLVGLSVGVMQNGTIVLAKGYGLRTLGASDSVTAETMFGIGSVTKQFTCSALLLLNEESKLSLRDPVSKYMPKLTRARDITLLDLGQHVSGYRDYYPLDFVDREMQKAATDDAIIAEYAMRPLDFEPGTRWSYSNTNFLILGRVIERVSGQPFGAFLSRRIFKPAGMTHTAYDPPQSAAMARGYTSFGLASPVAAEPEGKGWAGAAGAIWSTPSDLLAWDRALVDHKILSKASYQTLTSARRLSDGRSTGYGCGEGVNDRGQAIVLSHGGAVSGFVAQNTVIPSTRSAVVMLANTDFAAVGSLNAELVAKLMPRVDVPVVRGLAALDAGKAFLAQLEKGAVDRSTLGEDFDAYLTADKLAAAGAALHQMGAVSGVRLVQTVERGGMEVAALQFAVGTTNASALMYRTPDGKIQEFLLSRR